MPDDQVTSPEDLRESYAMPQGRAVAKQMDRMDRHCRDFVALSPFFLLSTAGADGRLDCSPRGDLPGFVRTPDEHTLLLPDRPGNNRLDSLTNIAENPEVGLLFLIPGFNDTLRMNGRAVISTDAALCAEFAVNGKPARSVIRVTVHEVYFHCAKALMRSRLWSPEALQDRSQFTSFSRILADQTGQGDANASDAEVAERNRKQMW